MSRVAKMRPRWNRPFRICKRGQLGVSYLINTLNGIAITGSVHGDQLKKFIKDNQGWWTSADDLSDVRFKEEDIEGEHGEVYDQVQEGQEDGEEDVGENKMELQPNPELRQYFEVHIPQIPGFNPSQYTTY
ncbi:hypothetical protein BKA56DRAFT_625680 [Ilyonectria sp. MPI-CAGE-AT-0026]|nr:hypothetical protein BKA56DRAFT_625680 [Ilyonectria sp. MPI-CAGE-AT-0026]